MNHKLFSDFCDFMTTLYILLLLKKKVQKDENRSFCMFEAAAAVLLKYIDVKILLQILVRGETFSILTPESLIAYRSYLRPLVTTLKQKKDL